MAAVSARRMRRPSVTSRAPERSASAASAGREAALWPDEEAHFADALNGASLRHRLLQRGAQRWLACLLPGEERDHAGRQVRERLRQRLWRNQFRQTRATALLHRLGQDAAPAPSLRLANLIAYGALGQQRDECRHAQLGTLLQRDLELRRLEHPQAERDAHRWIGQPLLARAQPHDYALAAHLD